MATSTVPYMPTIGAICTVRGQIGTWRVVKHIYNGVVHQCVLECKETGEIRTQFNFEVSELTTSTYCDVNQFLGDVAGLSVEEFNSVFEESFEVVEVSGIEAEQVRAELRSEEERPTPAQTCQQVQADRNRAPAFIQLDEAEKENLVKSMRNTNTLKKTESAMKVFRRWLGDQHESRNIWNIQPEELDPLIGSFLLAIRKGDGSEYEPDTLTSYHRSIERCLREEKYPWSIVKDRQFDTSRSILAAKRKQLKQLGKGNRPNAAEPIAPNEQEILREKGQLGTDNPEKLLNLLWMNNTILFGLRGGAENRDLRWGDVSLKRTNAGREFLEFNERVTKTRNGQNKSATRAFAPKQFAHDNKQTCPVEAYKTYAKHRPATMQAPDSAFYLSINKLRKPGSDVWFKSQPMSENHIRGLMKTMAEKGGLQGRKTSHSARKTTCTGLLHDGVAPTVIQQLTGHKNVQSINNYATASIEMQENMSDILSRNPQKPTCRSHPLPVVPTGPPVPSATHPNAMPLVPIGPNISSATNVPRLHPQVPQHQTSQYSQNNMLTKSNQDCHLDQLFSHAVFNNCSITINQPDRANRLDSSSPAPKKRRIRPLAYSDSDSS